jgi:hypothetical protein
MKRFLLSITLVMGIGTFSALAGGGHCGGGWHGGGCWGGGWHGGGCWGGHGYCGGYWPTFSFGIGFGYPAYGYYGYPAYGYAYAPVYSAPVYAYHPAQPTVSVAVAAAPTVRATTTSLVYSRPATIYVSPKPASPAPAIVPAAPVAAPRPSAGTWVMDPAPYRYTPAPATMYVNAGAPTTIVSVR